MKVSLQGGEAITFNARLGLLFPLAQQLSQKLATQTWLGVAFCQVLHLIYYRKTQFTFSEGVHGCSDFWGEFSTLMTV